MNNQEDPILAISKNDPKGYLFYALRQEFEAEIDRHQERTGATEFVTNRLKDVAGRHIDGLRRSRTDLDAATKQFRSDWDALELVRYINFFDIDWQPDARDMLHKHLLVTTPLKLEARIIERYQQITKELEEEEMTLILEQGKANIRGDRDLASRINQDLKRKDDSLRAYQGLGFYDLPQTIITAGFESFTLRYTKFDRQEYLKTYSYFDAVVRQEEDKYLRKIMKPFARKLKEQAGDLKAMGDTIREYLALDLASIGSSLAYKLECVEASRRFYPTHFTTIKFPSAQADFVAARLIAAQVEDAR